MRLREIQLEVVNQPILTAAGIVMPLAMLEGVRFAERVNARQRGYRRDPQYADGTLATVMVVLCLLGHPDFDAVEEHRNHPLLGAVLADGVPSSATLRQRLDGVGRRWEGVFGATVVALLGRYAPPVGGYARAGERPVIPVDIDDTVLDNSGTKKEGVAWTYRGVVGYKMRSAFLGPEGYLIHTELRPGHAHMGKDLGDFLDGVIERVRAVLKRQGQAGARVMVRMDAAGDSRAVRQRLAAMGVDYVIRHNPRRMAMNAWVSLARAHGAVVYADKTMRIWQGEVAFPDMPDGERLVYEVRAVWTNGRGQRYLAPQYELLAVWTNRREPVAQILTGYRDRGTSEQFHHEWKTDLNLERLPSGKWATNRVVLRCGMVAYNLLRILGEQIRRQGPRAPLLQRHRVNRRTGRFRLRTIREAILLRGAVMVRRARRWTLRIMHTPTAEVFRWLWHHLWTMPPPVGT